MLTKREAAIVSAYTGYLLGEWNDLHAYVEEIMGRPVWTHQFPTLAAEISKRARDDFVNLEVEK